MRPMLVAMAAFTFALFLCYQRFGTNAGIFFAESALNIDRSSNAAIALCLNDRFAAYGRPSYRLPEGTARSEQRLWTNEISLSPLRPLLSAEVDRIDHSQSLLYAWATGRLYAIDRIGTADAALVRALEAAHAVDYGDGEALLYRGTQIPSTCNTGKDDFGITPAYWETKGAGILHHWVHLYEAALSDNHPNRHQYGFAVPMLARAVAHAFHSDGPTGFVRAAWWVFFVAALVYGWLFLLIFRQRVATAALVLFLKLAIFLTIGQFGLLLAPGFQWTRELALLLVALGCIVAANRTLRSAARIAITAVALLAAWLLDPAFFGLGCACAAIAGAYAGRRLIVETARRHSRLAIGAAVAAVCAGLLLGISQRATFLYLDQAIDTVGTGLFSFTADRLISIVLIGLLALWQLLVSVEDRWERFVTAFFAAAAILCAAYYIITPDNFHYYKYLEYCCPLFVISIARSAAFVRARFNVRPAVMRVTYTLACCAVVAALAQRAQATPKEWELRVVSSDGTSAFSGKGVHSVNGRRLLGFLPENDRRHIAAFPRGVAYDRLLSPYDKYVTFFFDERNGFQSPDFTTMLESHADVTRAIAALTGGPHRVLADPAALQLTPATIVSQEHAILGSDYFASQLYFRERANLLELYNFLQLRCDGLATPARLQWMLLQCPSAFYFDQRRMVFTPPFAVQTLVVRRAAALPKAISLTESCGERDVSVVRMRAGDAYAIRPKRSVSCDLRFQSGATAKTVRVDAYGPLAADPKGVAIRRGSTAMLKLSQSSYAEPFQIARSCPGKGGVIVATLRPQSAGTGVSRFVITGRRRGRCSLHAYDVDAPLAVDVPVVVY